MVKLSSEGLRDLQNMENKVFKKRSGTTDRGKSYEDLIVANSILKLLKNEDLEDFKVASNDEKFGAFDDVILETESTSGIKQILALQLKHSNKEKVLTKNALVEKRGNFSIKKYFEDFKKLDRFEVPVEFILFTNLKFNIPDGEEILMKEEGIKIKILKVPDIFLLSTSSDSCCYKFETTDENYQRFFKRFLLYTNQKSVDKLKMNIAKNFAESFSCESHIVKDYFNFISEWSIKEGKKSKLDKNLMEHVIALYLLHSSIVPFVAGEVNQKSKLLREAISKLKTTTLSSEFKETISQVYGDVELKNIEEVNKLAVTYQITSKCIKNFDELNNLNKTKLLWLLGKHPLIVMENDTTYKAINLCKNEKFIILVKQTSETMFLTLSQLHGKEEILENFYCSLQGKEEFALKTLIELDQEFEDILTMNELVQMLNGDFLIGGGKEILPNPYIERFLNRNFIDIKFLHKIQEDTLVVISCYGNLGHIESHFNNLTTVNVEDYLNGKIKNSAVNSAIMNSRLLKPRRTLEAKLIFISEHECSKHEFEELLRRNPRKKNYHHLKLVNGNLEWSRTIGSVEELEVYKFQASFINEENFLRTIDNNIQLICADPGMGKSMLMKNIKNRLPSTTLVLMINPKEHFSYFRQKNPDIDSFLEYIFCKSNKNNHDFEKKFVKILEKRRQISIIWDGLDETSKENLESVLNLIKKLSEANFLQFITSRSNLKRLLENEFGVFAKNLIPFDETEQENYIKLRLNLDSNNEIITKIKKNVAILRYNDILGVPLQIFMLTELFRYDPEKYKSLVCDIFSLTDLYHYFVEEKFNLYYKIKAEVEASNDIIEQMIISNKRDRLKNYEKASLKIFFANLKIDCSSFLEEIKIGSDCLGFITEVSNDGIPNFVHNSYGEYFAASYLSKNYQSVLNFQEIILHEKFRNIRFLFDLLQARNCPAHIAVLYKNLEALMKHKDKITLKDSFGRNPLQLACSWSEKYVPLKTNKKFSILEKKYIIDETQGNLAMKESMEFQRIVEILAENCDLFEKDQLFRLDSFGYINKFLALFPMLRMSKAHRTNLSTFTNFENITAVLYYCIKFDYVQIFEVLQKIPLVFTKDRQSLLHLGAKYNSSKCLEKLLSIKIFADAVNENDINGSPPINIACQNGNVNIVRLLKTANADMVSVKQDGETPLCIACRMGHIELVQQLLSFGADVHGANKFGDTPIYLACSSGNKDLIKLLISLNANYDAPSTHGFTPLGVACLQGHLDIAKLLLIEYEAKINTVSVNGFIPLHMASFRGHLDIVRLLIEHGANINSADDKGVTPFHIACYKGYLDVADYLVTQGADINAVNKPGFNAVFMACDKGQTDIIQWLISKGVDTNIKDNYQSTPLHMVCQQGYPDIVQLLIENQADVDALDAYDETPLHKASRYGFVKTVKLLVGAKASVNAVNWKGETPLHVACENGFLGIVRFLVDSGADIGMRTKYGYLPWISANSQGHKEIIRFLKEVQKARKNV